MNKALILGDYSAGQLSPATLAAVTAARAMADEVEMVLAGDQIADMAQQAAMVAGVSKVLVADAPHLAQPLAEEVAPLLVAIAGDYHYILAAATTTGRDVLPRVAALLDVQQISNVSEVLGVNQFKHPIYAGNAIETVTTSDKQIVATIAPTAFDKAQPTGGEAVIEALTPPEPVGLTRFVTLETTGGDRPDLASASRVVAGGRGLGSAENFTLIEQLADTLGAAIGASRAAVDAGYVPNDYQVGQTGKIVAPELYIAVGISGAIQHLAGMKESGTIVATNKDPNAPIFEIADYGLVGDLFELVPELIAALKQA